MCYAVFVGYALFVHADAAVQTLPSSLIPTRTRFLAVGRPPPARENEQLFVRERRQALRDKMREKKINSVFGGEEAAGSSSPIRLGISGMDGVLIPSELLFKDIEKRADVIEREVINMRNAVNQLLKTIPEIREDGNYLRGKQHPAFPGRNIPQEGELTKHDDEDTRTSGTSTTNSSTIPTTTTTSSSNFRGGPLKRVQGDPSRFPEIYASTRVVVQPKKPLSGISMEKLGGSSSGGELRAKESSKNLRKIDSKILDGSKNKPSKSLLPVRGNIPKDDRVKEALGNVVENVVEQLGMKETYRLRSIIAASSGVGQRVKEAMNDAVLEDGGRHKPTLELLGDHPYSGQDDRRRPVSTLLRLGHRATDDTRPPEKRMEVVRTTSGAKKPSGNLLRGRGEHIIE